MRILWLKSELLHPVDKGGRIRTYQMLRELK
jgi:polysaccharide biosynthesis protein PslH